MVTIVINEKVKDKGFGIGHRHVQVVLMFFGFLLAYALRANLSLGIVEMKDPRHSPQYLKPLKISSSQQGIILSSFFVGYSFLQIPAGTLARKYGTTVQLSLAIGLSGVVTVLTPVITNQFGWVGLLITRLLVGLSQGSLYPCVNQHITKWVTPQERSRLFSFTFAGALMGSIFVLSTGGTIIKNAGGWPSIFYVPGALAIFWGIISYFIGSDSPQSHKYISDQERVYIEMNQINLSRSNQEIKTPWKEIWTSIPVWALLITYIANIWGYWTLLTMIPSYISQVLHYNIQSNGYLSALPYFCQWVTTMITSFVADFMVNRKILSQQVSRKLWNTISQAGPAVCLLVLALIKPNKTEAIALLTVSASLNAGMYVGYLMNPTDLSPNFTGTLMGMANGLSNISAVLGPLVSNIIAKDQTKADDWAPVFILVGVIYLVGSLTFLFFGSASIQPWNEPKQTQAVPIQDFQVLAHPVIETI